MFGENCDETSFDRITRAPGIMGGKACIRGMRVTAAMLVASMGAGATIEQLLSDYPYIEREDILQALTYAAWRMEDRSGEMALDELMAGFDDMGERSENGGTLERGAA